MGGDEGAAEEALSRVALKTYRKLADDGLEGDRLQAWIWRVARNACMDLHRERGRRREEVLDSPVRDDEGLSAPDRMVNPERAFLGKELEGVLWVSIHGLPERLRAVVVELLRRDNYRQVADHLMITEATARKRMQEARAALRSQLSAYRQGRLPEPPPAPRRREARMPDPAPAPFRFQAVRGLVVPGAGPAGPIQREELVLFVDPPPVATEARQRRIQSYVDDHPTGWKGYLQRGRLRLLTGDLEAAAHDLERVLERRPRQPPVWLELGRVRELQGRRKDGREVYGRAAELFPQPQWRLLFTACRDLCGGQVERGLQDLARAGEKSSRSSLPWVLRARVHDGQGRPGAVLADLEEALRRCPDDAAALGGAWEVLRLAGRGGTARRWTERAVAADPHHATASVRRLAAELRAGRRLDDVPDPRRNRGTPGGEGSAAAALEAFCLLCRGDAGAGRQRLVDFLRRHPRQREAHWELVRFLAAAGEPAAARAAWEEGRKLGLEDRSYDLLGLRVGTRSGDRRWAAQQRRLCLQRHGATWEVARTAAWSLAREAGALPAGGTGDGAVGEEARELSRLAVDLEPDLPALWVDHGRLLADLGRRREAREALERGLALLDGDDDGEIEAPARVESLRLQRMGGGGRSRADGGVPVRRAEEAVDRLRRVDPRAAEAWAGRLHRTTCRPIATFRTGEAPSRSDLPYGEESFFTRPLSEPSYP